MNITWLYEQLGIVLGRPCGEEAPARCFAAGGEHAHGDRTPSASVNLVSGAWFCHRCGTGGGAYDAALAIGLAPAAAMRLLCAAGLLERRGASGSTAAPVGRSVPPAARRPLAASERDVAAWSTALAARPLAACRIAATRCFDLGVLLGVGVGWDGARLTIPVRGGSGELVGVVRYAPKPRGRAPKALAVRGSRRDLVPPPEQFAAEHLVLCEGEPDALALLSHGVAAVAVPGVGSWRRAKPERFAGRRVTIAFDCDQAGREAARKVHSTLTGAGVVARCVDLAPSRSDGFDITDALRLDAQRLRRILAATGE